MVVAVMDAYANSLSRFVYYIATMQAGASQMTTGAGLCCYIKDSCCFFTFISIYTVMMAAGCFVQMRPDRAGSARKMHFEQRAVVPVRYCCCWCRYR